MSKPKRTYFVTKADLHRHYRTLGWNTEGSYKRKAVENAHKKQIAWKDSKYELSALCAISESLDKLVDVVAAFAAIVSENMIFENQERMRKRRIAYYAHREALFVGLEKKHGPCPKLVLTALRKQLDDQWEPHELIWYVNRFLKRDSFEDACWSFGWRESPDGRPGSRMYVSPPCGPKTKTRKLYNNWIARKAKAKG